MKTIIIPQQTGNRPARNPSIAAIALAVLLLLLCRYPGRTQNNQGANIPVHGENSFQPKFDAQIVNSWADVNSPIAEQRRWVEQNVRRQKQIVSESDKLLKLTRQLNDEVAASGFSSLTPYQLRKLNEIEKLAHNVRDKMLDSSGPAAPAPSAFTMHQH